MTSSDLIEVLNSMPNMEKLELTFHTKLKLEKGENQLANQKRVKLSDTLRLPNLKILNINVEYDPNVFEFFAQFLPENSIIELHSKANEAGGYFRRNLHEAICKFFAKQKSIKKVKVLGKELIKALDLISPEDLQIPNKTFCSFNIQCQPQLRSLRVHECSKEFFEEICKVTNLESLEIKEPSRGLDINLMQNLKSLKKVRCGKLFQRLGNYHRSNLAPWTSRFEFLEELELSTKFLLKTPEALECLPNLKVLQINTSLKLNVFAKFLPQLEVLKVVFEHAQELFEVDTGIVNENLKILFVNIRGDVCNFWKIAENFLEFTEILPNLEVLRLKMKKFERVSCDKTKDHGMENIEQKFFARLNELQKLKELKLMFIPLKFFKGNFADIAEEIKKLADKLEKVQLYFMDNMHELRNEPETYFYADLVQCLINLEGAYYIFRDRHFASFKPTLCIKSQK